MRRLRISLPILSVLAVLFALVFSSPASAAVPDRITGAIDNSQMVAVPNHVSPLAQARYDQGLIEPSYPLRVTMLFGQTAAQQAELQRLLKELQDRKSANFHHWLTPEQYADRFGLSPNDIEKISAWLGSQGFKVVYIARGRDSISFGGDAAQVQSAFKTEIHRYVANGETHFSNATPPMIPAALSAIVGGFRGLHNFVPKRMSVLHNSNSLLLHPDYTLTTNTGNFTFLAPGDIATIYDINKLYQSTPAIDGTGQRIVVVGQSDVYLADLNFFRSDFGLSTISGCTTNSTTNVITACNTTNFQLVIPTTAIDPGVNAGDLGESDLDIEWSGAVARNAQIIFVTSDLNSGGVFNSTTWAIDNKLAPVISISYGLCEAYSTPPSLTTQDLEFQKAASFGISVFAATGDEAAATCDGDVFNTTTVSSASLGLSVSYPASSPEVTAVGGTEFNEGSGTYWGSTNGTNGASVLPNGPDNGYIPELAWNDSALGVSQGFGLDGTGGGPSNCVNGTGTTTENGNPFVICAAPPNGGFAKPSYQTALTPSDSVRDIPDISFSASNVNDPYIVCTAQSETNGSSSTSTCATSINDALTTWNSAFGGTSVSTPVAAGMAVLLNQFLGANGLGNLNTELYSLYGASSSAFHDIVAGSDSTDQDTSDNIVPCTVGSPTFEPAALQCPSAGSFGYSAGTSYDLVTGLGSIDFNALFQAWPSFTLSGGSSVSVVAGHGIADTVTLTPQNGFSGTVTFGCSSSPTGATCSFVPPTASSGTTTVTIQTLPNMAAGSATVTVNGTAGAIVHSTSINLTVTATDQSFTLAPSVATISVTQGATGTASITMTPANGFSAPLTYTCTDSVSESTCNVSPATATTQNPVTLNVTTTAPTAKLAPPLNRGSRIFYAFLPGLLGIFACSGITKSKTGKQFLVAIAVLGVSTVWLSACGGTTNNSNKNPGTPTGTYTITVNATTGGASPVQASTTVKLQVN